MDLRLELPILDPGSALSSVEVEADGLELLSTRRLPSTGPEAVWSARVRIDAEPGPLVVILRAIHGAGEPVEFRQQLTVVPASDDSPFPWGTVAIGVVLALGATIAVLWLARRRA